VNELTKDNVEECKEMILFHLTGMLSPTEYRSANSLDDRADLNTSKTSAAPSSLEELQQMLTVVQNIDSAQLERPTSSFAIGKQHLIEQIPFLGRHFSLRSNDVGLWHVQISITRFNIITTFHSQLTVDFSISMDSQLPD
jgi:hypothetical protein